MLTSLETHGVKLYLKCVIYFAFAEKPESVWCKTKDDVTQILSVGLDVFTKLTSSGDCWFAGLLDTWIKIQSTFERLVAESGNAMSQKTLKLFIGKDSVSMKPADPNYGPAFVDSWTNEITRSLQLRYSDQTDKLEEMSLAYLRANLALRGLPEVPGLSDFVTALCTLTLTLSQFTSDLADFLNSKKNNPDSPDIMTHRARGLA